jgi:DNA repair protein SbcC/Rad50
MRPLRLVIDGFGSYRERADLLLSDVDYFVLTGPTGSGKSTVIDAMCFALYGTVPRWGNGVALRNALAPSASGGRVCLIFEASGRRYAVVRRLARNSRGVVQTKEARLERLDDAAPVDGDLARVLEASVEQLAEGVRVTAAVSELLGIGYEHFTQCVLLPQGRFAEFLNATPGERQDLLIELLAFSVYEDVGQRARNRGRDAATKLSLLDKQLAELGEISTEAIATAARRVAELAALGPEVDAAVADLNDLREQWRAANQLAAEHRRHLEELAGLRMPPDVRDLAARLSTADDQLAKRTAERDALELAETEAEQHIAGLAELSTLDRWLAAHRDNVALREQLVAAQRKIDTTQSTEDNLTAELATAEESAARAETALSRAEQQHRAVALAADLEPGEPCPVCNQTVAEPPHHDVPADLGAARAEVKAARESVAETQRRLTAASKATAAARAAADGLHARLAEVAATLDGAPTADEVETQRAARVAADTAVDKARAAVRAARTAVTKAQRDRDQLRDEEQRAWSALRASRDRFVALSAPAVEGLDLAAAWQTLLTWASDRLAALQAEVTGFTRAEKALLDKGKAGAAALVARLAEHGVPLDDAGKAPVALAKHHEGAQRDLTELRSRRDRAETLRAEAAKAREESEVATMLGNLLRSDGFEAWLCAEALDSLVLEASETLMQLSGNQYELDRGERNEFVVIDHNDAGTRRAVSTLSGGETFQASLALALALSHQVMGLSGGRRSLNAMFLDEGFGTLDEATLDTVASTLERLVEQTGSMIGIVTHVPALAERVPVQFAVTRTGASSRVERVGV